MDEAEYYLKSRNKKTILFIDEIHRFNKAQQGAFLKHIETGAIILIGATTENPAQLVDTLKSGGEKGSNQSHHYQQSGKR